MQIAEDRLHDAQAAAVEQPPRTAVDAGFHCRGLWVQDLSLAAVEEGHLPIGTGIRFAQALCLERAALADRLRALEAHTTPPLDDGLRSAELQGVPCWADTGLLRCTELKILGLKPLRLTLTRPSLLLDGFVQIANSTS